MSKGRTSSEEAGSGAIFAGGFGVDGHQKW